VTRIFTLQYNANLQVWQRAVQMTKYRAGCQAGRPAGDVGLIVAAAAGAGIASPAISSDVSSVLPLQVPQ
jgi:hypothetical protein